MIAEFLYSISLGVGFSWFIMLGVWIARGWLKVDSAAYDAMKLPGRLRLMALFLPFAIFLSIAWVYFVAQPGTHDLGLLACPSATVFALIVNYKVNAYNAVQVRSS